MELLAPSHPKRDMRLLPSPPSAGESSLGIGVSRPTGRTAGRGAGDWRAGKLCCSAVSLGPPAEPDLKRVLAEGRVVARRRLPISTRSSRAIEVVTLHGGVEAFWKRGDVDPPGLAGVRREVAAYELASILGWHDLLQVTVLRREMTEAGTRVEVAAIELLAEGVDDLAPTAFPRTQVERAGVFDAVIANIDRMGHNWRGLPDGAGGFQLKLYDHELAFGRSSEVSSSFWSAISESVPVHLRSTLVNAGPAVREASYLEQLLGRESYQALVGRLGSLAGPAGP
jgi:hypothetical protein